MKFILFLLLLSSFTPLLGQPALYENTQAFRSKVRSMSMELANQLERKKTKRVAVLTFTHQGRANTQIGDYLANKFSGGLTQASSSFALMSRSQVKRETELLAQQGGGNNIDLLKTGKEVSDATSEDYHETKEEITNDKIEAVASVAQGVFSMIGNKKPFKGTDVIVRGSVTEVGDYLDVYIEAIRNNKNGDMIGFIENKIPKTPEIRDLLSQANMPTSAVGSTSIPITNPNPGNTPQSGFGNSITFKHQSIQIEVTGCIQTGRSIECNLNIVSHGTDIELYAYKQDTRIISAEGGHEFHAGEIKLADKSTTGSRISKTLVADYPIQATLRFNNVNKRVSAISQLQIYAYANERFYAKLQNIPVSLQ